MKKITLTTVLAVLVMLITGVSQAQAVQFVFIVNSATCNATTVTIDVSADIELPGVFVEVYENQVLTYSNIYNNSGLITWDTGSPALPASRIFTKRVLAYNGTTNATGVGAWSQYSLDCTGRFSGEPATVTVTSGPNATTTTTTGNGDPQPVFGDGRINNYDSHAPVAVYPINVNDDTALHFYDVDANLLLVVSPGQINSAPDNPDSPVLVAEGPEVSLYRIAGEGGGLWQVNATQYNGKIYVLIFRELFPNGNYTSYEIG